MVLERDPTTLRITRLETSPGDSEQALSFVKQLLDMEQTYQAHLMAAGVAAATATSAAAERSDGSLPGTQSSSAVIGQPIFEDQASLKPDRAGEWLGDAVAEYVRNLGRSGRLSSNTIQFSHLPSIRVFRELISSEQRNVEVTGEGGETAEKTQWDIRCDQITVRLIDTFLAQFWHYPSRQGKSHLDTDARKIIAAAVSAGVEPQSAESRYKKLGHILGLLTWLGGRGQVSPHVVGALKMAIEGLDGSAPTEERQELDLEGDEEAEGGYVAFNPQELARIFEPETYTKFAA